MQTFWNDLPKPFFILAPMEAVTDVVFRHVVASAARPDVLFTEFTNASSYCSPKGEHSTRGRLAFTADEHPMVAQIWGDKPEEFAQMAKGLAAAGFMGIDINMGCPVKNAVKAGGSGLIRQPELAAQLIAAAKEGGLPVSVKTRLGYSNVNEWRDWLTHILKQDVVNLTIHLRTRKEMSKVPAHFELIPEIKKLRDEIAPNTLLTINGDIRDRQHGEALVDEYGIDGVMIGRGIFTNPFAFEQEPQDHTRDELLDLLSQHLDLFDKYSTELEPRRFEPLKRFFKIYVRNFAGAGELRAALMNSRDTTQARKLLRVALETDDINSTHSPAHSPQSKSIRAIIFDTYDTIFNVQDHDQIESIFSSWHEQGIRLYLCSNENNQAPQDLFDEIIPQNHIEDILSRAVIDPKNAVFIGGTIKSIQANSTAQIGLHIGLAQETEIYRELVSAGIDYAVKSLTELRTVIK